MARARKRTIPLPNTGACSRAAISGSMQTHSMANIMFRQLRAGLVDSIAKGLRSGMGADDPEHPQYQVGDGCLVDQLLGQYLAEVAGLGPLLAPANIRKTLESIYRYNHKPTLFDHDSVQRTFALNDESALVICDYGKGERPRIPFPYYAEVMTGFEYSTASLMLYTGMLDHGLECIGDIRSRYDGVRRNPWDEAECGHHYARAMASWSAVLALSGFRYRGPARHVIAAPRIKHPGVPVILVGGNRLGHIRAHFTCGPDELLARRHGGLPASPPRRVHHHRKREGHRQNGRKDHPTRSPNPERPGRFHPCRRNDNQSRTEAAFEIKKEYLGATSYWVSTTSIAFTSA